MKQDNYFYSWARKRCLSFLLVIFYIISEFVVRCVHDKRSVFIVLSLPARGITALFKTSSSDGIDAQRSNVSPLCSIHTDQLTTAPGKPVSRYAPGGAAQSVKVESQSFNYCDLLSHHEERTVPFNFYDNPQLYRYLVFISRVTLSFINDGNSNKY